MSKCPLEFFVASQSQGQLIESSSEFTLDSIRARQKLSESQLPKPGLWLVKLVQAANVLGSDLVTIGFGKKTVTMEFRTKAWSHHSREILAQFLSGAMSEEPFLFHFLTGLRGGLTEDTASCQWSVVENGEKFEVNIDSTGTEVHVTESDCDAEGTLLSLTMTRPPRWPGLRRAMTMPVKHLIQRTAEEFLAVKSYCWPSNVPIKLDGRMLETHYQWNSRENSNRLFSKMEEMATASPVGALPVIVGRHQICLPGPRDSLDIPWAPNTGESEPIEFGDGLAIRQTKGFFWGQAWIDSVKPQGEDAQATLLLINGHEMESRVEFICDGAVVGTQVLPWETSRSKVFGHSTPQNQFKLGVRVLASSSTSQLDLSHFRVRDTVLFSISEIDLLGESIRRFAELCLTHSKRYQFPFTKAPKSSLARLGSSALGLVLKWHLPMKLVFWLALKKELQSLLKALDEAELADEDCVRLDQHDS